MVFGTVLFDVIKPCLFLVFVLQCFYIIIIIIIIIIAIIII